MEFNTQIECLIKVNHRNQQMFLRILLKWHRIQILYMYLKMDDYKPLQTTGFTRLLI